MSWERGKVAVSVGPDRSGEFEEIEIGIERLHLEQDAGKSIHDQHPIHESFVDLNRTGCRTHGNRIQAGFAFI